MPERRSRSERVREAPRNARKLVSNLVRKIRRGKGDNLPESEEGRPTTDRKTKRSKGRKKSNWSKELSLHDWQKEALDWWAENEFKGVVEAVTGAGKTRVAIAAAEFHLRHGDCVVVIVPTTALLHQWRKEAQRHLVGTCGMNVSIGLMGGGYKDTLRSSQFLIATVQTALNKELPRVGQNGLIILDEVHRYGGTKWSKVLKPRFARRLGLTATYEREDSGKKEYLDPYFDPSGKPFEVGYRRALDEDVIAHFKIAFIGVKFSPMERHEYDEHVEKVNRYRRRLVREFGVPEEPFGDFMRAVSKLSEGGEGKATGTARAYLGAFSKRREVLAGASGKYEKIADLVRAIRAADRTIMFTQTKGSASQAKERMDSMGVKGAKLTSDMDASEREKVFVGFEDGEHEMVVSPKLLDEGVDIPAADLAIILASSRSKRQMIQRMGRVIRKKKDGCLARIAILYVEGSSEDPSKAHEDFLKEVEDVAHDIRDFDSTASSAKICKYLNQWTF